MLRQLWEFVASNPIILIIVLGYIASMAGNVMTRAARKAQEQQAAERQKARERRIESASPVESAASTTFEESAPTSQRSPEDVAEEIRRMMGLEPEQTPVRVEVVEEPVVAEPVSVRPERGRSHGGDLAAELERKERERAARFDARLQARSEELDARSDALDARASESRFGDLPEHHSKLERPVAVSPSKRRRRSAKRSTRLFDASDPARAIVALEVLGPPRAMREWE